MARQSVPQLLNRLSFYIPALLIAVGVLSLTAHYGNAENPDAHEIYENSCSRCHEDHAGDFVHAALQLKNNAAVSVRTGLSADDYMKSGHGKLLSEHIAALNTLFLFILENDGLFQSHCRICHGPARLLAKSKLIVKDGVLMGRYTGRNIQEFLYGHGRLTKSEAEKMTDILSGFRAAQGNL